MEEATANLITPKRLENDDHQPRTEPHATQRYRRRNLVHHQSCSSTGGDVCVRTFIHPRRTENVLWSNYGKAIKQASRIST